MANHILCPPCFDSWPEPLEEKACSHGLGAVTCVGCGAVRDPEHAEPWMCSGFMYEPTTQAPSKAEEGK